MLKSRKKPRKRMKKIKQRHSTIRQEDKLMREIKNVK